MMSLAKFLSTLFLAGIISSTSALAAARCPDPLPDDHAQVQPEEVLACIKELQATIAIINSEREASKGRVSVNVPLGAIIAWHRDFPTLTKADDQPIVLPDGWALCDGQPITVAGSPWVGRNTPNLNGISGDVEYQKFLRGGPKSGVAQSATQVAVTLETSAYGLYYYASGNVSGVNRNFDHPLGLQEGSQRKGLTGPAGFDDPLGQVYGGTVRPTNMSVIWIMKVLN